MKTDDFKKTWQSRVDGNIQNYSNEELNRMIVKSARKSMKAIQPNLMIRGVVGMMVAILVWLMVTDHYSAAIGVMYVVSLLMLLGTYFFVEQKAYKLNKYNSGVPVKEWLRQRVEKVKKSRDDLIKYDFLKYGSALLSAYVFYSIFQVLRNVRFNWLSVIIFIALFVYILILRHCQMRNNNKTLDRLTELYKQLEEEE
ncbi:MAG: hypothetical protein LBK12_02250 [Odoribacteraceae bacterium]|jgi:L-asparagine transporter-like permease|nr:hypothetical protein [Odoribacteraceae bacterium]